MRLAAILFLLVLPFTAARAELLGMKVERAVTEEEMKASLREIDLVDEKGAPFDLRATIGNGKPTLVSLWAHWCPNCLSEAKGYKALAKACPERWNVVFVSTSAADFPKDVTKLKSFGLPWRVYRIADTAQTDAGKSRAARAFYGLTKEGGVVTPTHYFLDRAGAVEAIVSGKMDFAEPERLAAFCGS
jgi:thiol-disulfide isomerase/thioredoxin